MAPAKTIVVAALLVAVVGLSGSLSEAATRPHTGPTLATCQQIVPTETVVAGKLTVATNNPALTPWFVNDTPSNKAGYESALTYQIASLFGVKVRAVAWYTEPFELATAAGTKPFDFDINEVTYSKTLSTSVTTSNSYYNVNQSLVALKTDAIVRRHGPAELRAYRYGVLAGSPAVTLVTTQIKPTRAPTTYKTLAGAVSALQAKRIDVIVIDTPTGQYLTSKQLPKAAQFAQLHTTGQYYVLVLQKGNHLLGCINAAIKQLRVTGELSVLNKKYLGVYNSIPFIKP